MAGSYRHQALIEAPIEDVWAIVSDPRTHPEWWPDVVDVQIDEPLVEGGEYTRTSKMLPFLDAVEAVWVAERLEDLKEARFRCTKTRLLLQGLDSRRARGASQGGGRKASCTPRVRPVTRGYVRPITSRSESADRVA